MLQIERGRALYWAHRMKIRHACLGLLVLASLSSQSVYAQLGGGSRSGPANRPVEPLPVIQVDDNDTGLQVSTSPSVVAPAPTLEPQVAAPDATHDPVTGPVDVDIKPPATVPAPGLDVWQPYMGPTTASPPNLTYSYPSSAETNTSGSGGYIAASPVGTYGSAIASNSPMPSLPPGNGFVSNSASAVGGYGGYGAAAVPQPGSYGSPSIAAAALPGGYGYGSAASAMPGSYSTASPSPNTLAGGLRRLLQAAAALGGQDTTSNPIIEVPTSPVASDNDSDDNMGATSRVPGGDTDDTTAATSSGSVGGYGTYASQPAALGYSAYGSVNGWGYGQISSASAYGGNHAAAAAMPGGYGTAAAAVLGNYGRRLLQDAGTQLGTATTPIPTTTASAADGMPGSYGAASTAMGYGSGSATGSPAQQGASAVGSYGTAAAAQPGGYSFGSQAASVSGSYGQAASTAMGYGGASTQGRRRLLQGGQEPGIEISQGTLTETGAITDTNGSTADTGSDTPSSYTNYGLGGAVGVYTNGGYGDYGNSAAAGAYGVHLPPGGYGYGFPSASTQSGRRHLLQVAAAQAGASGEPLIEIPSAAATDAAADSSGADGSYQPAPGSYGAATTAMGYGNTGGNGAYGSAAVPKPGGYGGYGASAAALPGAYGGPSSAAATVPGGYGNGASASPIGATTGVLGKQGGGCWATLACKQAVAAQEYP